MWKLRVYVYREKSGYQRRYVKLPSVFPEAKEVWVLTEKELKHLRGTNGETSNGVPKETIGVPKNLIDGFYYVLCPDCGRIAHLTVEYKNGEAWYYCPECNLVFPKTRRGGK